MGQDALGMVHLTRYKASALLEAFRAAVPSGVISRANFHRVFEGYMRSAGEDEDVIRSSRVQYTQAVLLSLLLLLYGFC